MNVFSTKPWFAFSPMLLKILIALAALIVGFVIFVATRPSDFRVTRSITVAAPASIVFAQVNDLHNYHLWNPFGKADPAMKVAFDGPRSGRDASLSWSGNSQVGVGRMTIAESRPNEHIRMLLDFIKPFPSTANAEFTFKSEGDRTAVTWSMYGTHTFVPKMISVVMNMDKMIGDEFEKGLAEMKVISEANLQK